MSANEEGGAAVRKKLEELQALYKHLRSYEGPFDPGFPRTVFHMIFCPPLHCCLDPLEVYGIVQRVFQSKDGKYLSVSFGETPAFRREAATPQDKKAAAILGEIRDLVKTHGVWVTYVDPETKSYFPKVSFMAGTLLPPPGEPVVVPIMEYFEKLRAFDATDPPPPPGELIPPTIDMTDLDQAARTGVELADPIPDLCSSCGTRLEENTAPVRGAEGLMKGSRRCPDCQTVYVRPPRDEELTPEQRAKRDRREAIMSEFLRRIQDEFPPKSSMIGTAEPLEDGSEPEDPYGLLGDLRFGADESWRGGSDP